MPARPPLRVMNSVHKEYPDDDSVKHVEIHAAGLQPPTEPDHEFLANRHVLIQWLNGIAENGLLATQVLQLTGGPGNYKYYAPLVELRDSNSTARNQLISVGEFSRAQRDKILELASQVKFEEKSRVNNCRVWLRSLLEAMVREQLITQAKFDEILKQEPLQNYRLELPV